MDRLMKKHLAKKLFEGALALRQLIHTYGNELVDGVVTLDELKTLDEQLGNVSKKAFNYACEAN